MGTVSGANTRRYHGHLVVSDDDLNRTVLLYNLEAWVRVDGQSFELSTQQYDGAIHPEGYKNLELFDIDVGTIWRFQHIEKRMSFDPTSSDLVITYKNITKSKLQIYLRPLVCHKPYHADFVANDDYPASIEHLADSTSIADGSLTLKIEHPGATWMPFAGWYYRFEHQRELERGLSGYQDAFCPCELQYEVEPGNIIELRMSCPELSRQNEPNLPDNIVFKGSVPTIVAGYPWFTDWGRDTMISIPGLLLPDHHEIAVAILRHYRSQIFQGLIPNRAVETGERDYNTADATLWFAHAIHQVLLAQWDLKFARDRKSVV